MEESSSSVQGWGVGAQKLKHFTQVFEYKCPRVIFYKIVTICGQLHGRSCIKMWADLLKRFKDYGGLNLGGAFYPNV